MIRVGPGGAARPPRRPGAVRDPGRGRPADVHAVRQQGRSRRPTCATSSASSARRSTWARTPIKLRVRRRAGRVTSTARSHDAGRSGSLQYHLHAPWTSRLLALVALGVRRGCGRVGALRSLPARGCLARIEARLRRRRPAVARRGRTTARTCSRPLLYGVLAVTRRAFAAASSAVDGTLVLLIVLVPAVGVARPRSQLHQGGPARAQAHRARAPGAGGPRPGRIWRRAGGPSVSPPKICPTSPGFEVGRVYQAGIGSHGRRLLRRRSASAPSRLAAVIGDVSGHGIEPAITAFQAKYLLRVFLRQYRDPAQALEELNTQMSAMGRSEEFISLCVVLFDTEAGTLRYALGRAPGCVAVARARGPTAARHRPAADDRPEGHLREPGDTPRRPTISACSTPTGSPRSATASSCSARTASPRSSGVIPACRADVLCKSLLEAARDFSSGPITDDVAILAIRRA